MKKLLEKLFVLFKPQSRQTKAIHKSRGQSLVEFAIAFPVIIMLFSGVIEFGFILNYYLSLLDATREAARFYSTQDPWDPDPNTARNETYWFYADTAAMVKDAVEPRNVNDTSRKIVLNSTTDDVIVTVYSMCGTNVYSFPNAGGYRLYGNKTSVFTNASMAASRLSGAPNAGVLLVEIHYNYRQVLALPWLTVFLSNPLPLRSYTIMPLRSAVPPMADDHPSVSC
jgi:TadE-like protein